MSFPSACQGCPPPIHILCRHKTYKFPRSNRDVGDSLLTSYNLLGSLVPYPLIHISYGYDNYITLL